MMIRNFFESSLAQASYLVGCPGAGEAIVIDPARDIKPYLEAADLLGLKIVAVTETHIHADFLSGARELAAATGARIYLSGAGGPSWQYAYADQPGIVRVQDGDRIQIGGFSLQTLHTPGHTPEHISFLLVDHVVSELPHSLFAGDFVFVGDVGRPDLLERAVKVAGSMDESARLLFRSLQKLASLPDSLLIWPGHGAGSSCGKALGGSPATTLGYERVTNWALRATDEDRFVDEILSGQPAPPAYFREMKRLNQVGPALRPAGSEPVRRKSVVGQLIDIRTADTIRAGSSRDAIALPYGKAFTGWAGWVLDYSLPITLLADNQEIAELAVRDLASIGFDDVHGWMHPIDMEEGSRDSLGGIAPDGFDSDDVVLDVREDRERIVSHVQGSLHIPYGQLQRRLGELPTDRRIVVYCAAGNRSLIACSILRRAGFTQICELTNGFSAIESTCPNLVCQGSPK